MYDRKKASRLNTAPAAETSFIHVLLKQINIFPCGTYRGLTKRIQKIIRPTMKPTKHNCTVN